MLAKTSFLLRRRSSATLKTPVVVKVGRLVPNALLVVAEGKTYLSESPVDPEPSPHQETPLEEWSGWTDGRGSLRKESYHVDRFDPFHLATYQTVSFDRSQFSRLVTGSVFPVGQSRLLCGHLVVQESD